MNYLSILHDISTLLDADLPEEQILSEVIDTLFSELKLVSTAIMLLAPDSEQIDVEMVRNDSGLQKSSVTYRVGEGIIGRVIASGDAIIVEKVLHEPAFLDRLNLKKRYAGAELSFLCVPVKNSTRTIGALSVTRLQEDSADLDSICRCLGVVAAMIAHDIKTRLESAARTRTLEAENSRLRHELEDRYKPENIIGNSKAMREVYAAIHQVARANTTVLIRGESGTGKELVAHALHYASDRAKGPFIRVNCAALSETLLESELFGHEKGAFTGAITTRKGHIALAENGTLFLDEIGEFSQAIQIKLLRVLQEREYTPVGSDRPLKTNARIITATNRDLETAVAAGTFRQDFYYRINVYPIPLPSLRDRRSDILELANHFTAKYSKETGKDIRRISTPAINMMVSYHWPGNVRELENCIERAVILSNEGVIHGHHLPPTLQTADATDTVGAGSFEDKVALYERDLIVDSLKRNNGSMAAVARDLQTTTRIIRYKLEKLDIDFRKFRRGSAGKS